MIMELLVGLAALATVGAVMTAPLVVTITRGIVMLGLLVQIAHKPELVFVALIQCVEEAVLNRLQKRKQITVVVLVGLVEPVAMEAVMRTLLLVVPVV